MSEQSTIVSPLSEVTPPAPTARTPRATITKAPAPTLANAKAVVIVAAIFAAMKAPFRKTAAALLTECAGNVQSASKLVKGTEIASAIELIGKLVPVLRNTCPAELFADGNNRGVRIGELFAGPLGVGALFRVSSRANLSEARKALVESAK